MAFDGCVELSSGRAKVNPENGVHASSVADVRNSKSVSDFRIPFGPFVEELTVHGTNDEGNNLVGCKS